MAATVESPMTGSVWKVEKKDGDSVEAGEPILILESMKMEIPVEAPCSGRVAQVHVAEGDMVEEGAALVTIEDA